MAEAFSPKQRRVLRWWTPKSPDCRFDAYIYSAKLGDHPAAELFFDEFMSAYQPVMPENADGDA